MANDAVNHPLHYANGKIEVIDFIEDKHLGFCLGNAVKYIARAGHKDPAKRVEDLEKAIWYLRRQIKTWQESKSIGKSCVPCAEIGLVIEDDELSSIAGMDNFAHYVHGFSDAMALFDVGGSVTVNKRSMASLKDLYLNSDYRQQANILAVLDCIGAKEAIYALFEEK